MLKNGNALKPGMKRGVVIVLALLIALPCALATTFGIHHIIIDQQPPERYATEYNVFVTYDAQIDSQAQVYMPDLDLYDVSMGKPAHLALFVPSDTPPGDYLVRVVVRDDDNRAVRYRYITVP
jgi:hypothetical protein